MGMSAIEGIGGFLYVVNLGDPSQTPGSSLVGDDRFSLPLRLGTEMFVASRLVDLRGNAFSAAASAQIQSDDTAHPHESGRASRAEPIGAEPSVCF